VPCVSSVGQHKHTDVLDTVSEENGDTFLSELSGIRYQRHIVMQEVKPLELFSVSLVRKMIMVLEPEYAFNGSHINIELDYMMTIKKI